ncbi:MAG: AmmeMemoRadiSam system protein A [Deltaproteobacteria bacterium]|nr:AmmeMemoRadiSam system protein A [Deltaproteobacteria bacterium]
MQKNNNSSKQISDQHGQALVKLARQAILKRLGRKINMFDSDSLSEILSDDDLQAKRGTFVTLKINSRLRGCIGSLSADESIVEGVRRNAINAAFHDPRFSPLSVEESDNIDIEISILTESRLLEYIDGVDLISKLRVDVDGVILRKGAACATFLPQVWKQLSRPEMFLSQLCLKAGLSADTWQKAGLEVKIYQVQYFEENK